ncbi:alpha-ketoglutarate-dependent dioxygenase AlkB [Nocardia sp. NPDC051990]|uniref:alpha-ketoglutarate-dependent dioxygenase AlkB n=1 Tax=Nocardia sp. NPDC051990 TaxID=3155285 RepID=UPI003423991D
MFNRYIDEPRLTCEFRDAAAAFLVELTAELSNYCEVAYDNIWMNWYRDHRDSAGWHADRPANVPPTATVPVVSLGATRRFLIPPSSVGRSTTFIPAGGDALIMRGRCQRDRRHCAPKQQTPAGPRMSLNFGSTAQVNSSSPD